MENRAKTRPLILIVEDEAEFAAILREGLKDEYDTELAGNVEEAKLLLGTHPFDVILSDLMLPGKEQGLDFLERAMHQQPGAKRILMSGYLNPELLARSVSLAGLSRCLMKPVDTTSLKAVLREILPQK